MQSYAPKTSATGQRGAAALVAILVICAIALTIAISLSLGSLGGMTTAQGEWESAESLAGVDGCVDEALQRLTWDSGYTGGTLTLGPATCQIGVQGTGSTRTVQATSTVATFIRKIRVDLTLNGSRATLTGWQEKTD
ncbi:MAG: hypothetical protein PHI63_04955 [Patescibacteria group bacterium]|nr:hypothetical protein [Patescibacteria group bacterium]